MSEFLKVSRLQSIKTRILIFALSATILPALILGWLSYLENSKLLREKISHELRHATVEVSGNLNLWLKERLYDLRVFTSSYIVSENLEQVARPGSSRNETQAALDSVEAYLESVCDKFGLYEALYLVSPSGEPMASSTGRLTDAVLPDHWQQRLADRHATVEEARLYPHVDNTALIIAETINASDGRSLGVLAARIKLRTVVSILASLTDRGIDEIYLMDAEGRMLVSSLVLAEPPKLTRHPMIQNAEVSQLTDTPSDYTGFRDKSVVGMAVPIPSMQWVMVAEIDKASAYAEIIRLRRVTIILVLGLMLGIGGLAYIFGHSLVRPLRRLSREAAKVASGNLDVEVPVKGLSEVSYLTQVFNHMVSSLCRGREEISSANRALQETNQELHQLSITDGLTGLHNRKHIMELLMGEIARGRRYQSSLAVMLLDIDHFKMINDTQGHQAGDAVLRRLAESLRQSLRECDHVGRYGGEEFLVILPESDMHQGVEVAERIRKQVGEIVMAGNRDQISISVSIGVAEFPHDGEDAESVIAKADDALYQAKAGGRDQVAVSDRACRLKPKVVPLHPNVAV